jgi:hypothetical protein
MPVADCEPIECAATWLGITREQFVREAARRAAEEALPGRAALAVGSDVYGDILSTDRREGRGNA